jgi:hypothetical protein
VKLAKQTVAYIAILHCYYGLQNCWDIHDKLVILNNHQLIISISAKKLILTPAAFTIALAKSSAHKMGLNTFASGCAIFSTVTIDELSAAC